MPISIKGYGYSLPGTGTYTPLSPGSDPASQYSLTSPGSFPFAFSGSSGGTAPLGYTLGTGYGTVVGTVTGTFPNYNLTLNNPESYYVVVVNTTDGAGQIVQSYGYAATAPSADLLPGGNSTAAAQLVARVINGRYRRWGAAVGVGVAVADGDGIAVGVGDAVAVGVSVGDAVGEGVAVGGGDAIGVGVVVGVLVGVGGGSSHFAQDGK